MQPPPGADADARALLAHHAAATSPLRYTAPHPVAAHGWLAKQGRSLRTRRSRFFTLNGSVLASHRSATAAPSWHVSLADALVERGALPREIRLALPARALSFVAPTPAAFRMWIVAMRRASLLSSRVDEYYAIGRLVGEGMNGQVRLAHDKMTHEPVAVKMVPRLGRQNETHFLAREVQIILSVAHPNIVRTIDVFVRSRRIHFVMEYLPGGELFDFIARNTHFTETHAAAVMIDLLSALHYLHSRNIVHRDVKLENLLCANSTWPLNVKLADFGFANYLDAENRPTLNSFVGTPYYIAPEMLRGDPHGCPVDVWASGVVLYILLSGKFPFGGNSESEYYQRVLSKNAYFPPEEWHSVSHDAKSLLRGMLCKDPHKRLTVEECLQHPWLARARAPPSAAQHSASAAAAAAAAVAATATAAAAAEPAPAAAEPVLHTGATLRHNRAKRGKWRYVAMLNRSLTGAPDAVMPPQLHRDCARAKHTLSDCAAAPCAAPADIAAHTVLAADSELVNRRPSLIRRILSSQKLSMDRFERQLPSARLGAAGDDHVDEAAAHPRKTLSLFSKDGPLRRSFHRAGGGGGDDDEGINFVNSQSQKLPPKIARERQRQQKLAEAAARRGARVAFFGSCKLGRGEPRAQSHGYHSSPRLAAHMLEPVATFFVPSASEPGGSGTCAKVVRVGARGGGICVEDVVEPVSSPPSMVRSDDGMDSVMDEHGDEVRRGMSMEYVRTGAVSEDGAPYARALALRAGL